jgi:hypothetical protein
MSSEESSSEDVSSEKVAQRKRGRPRIKSNVDIRRNSLKKEVFEMKDSKNKNQERDDDVITASDDHKSGS